MNKTTQTRRLDQTIHTAKELLGQCFGYTAFLPGQEEAMQSILSGRNALVVMPTGSGKSLLYQLPALMTEDLTLIISPLIALMKDQVDELLRLGLPASFINSSLSRDEQMQRIDQCRRGHTKMLYVAPERFRIPSFVAMLGQVRIARMAVDEAHCISEWGHDFRPDYRRLKDFCQRIGNPPVTALTATATPRVRKDIIESLGLTAPQIDVHVQGFDRPNLILSVVNTREDNQKKTFLRDLLDSQKGSGIIYAGTRRVAEELAEELQTVEPTATAYHAGLEPRERTRVQEGFISGRMRVVVATIAFGMGIDKRDVRFVAHYHYPGSVEGYYQEIGRSGRDGRDSICVLLYSPGDRRLREFFIDLNYPTREMVRDIYQTLWEIPENPIRLTYQDIAARCETRIMDGQVGAAVRLLDAAGVTRALAGEALAGIGLDRPGAELLRSIRGPVQRRVFQALATAVDLETPGAYRVGLGEICAAADLELDQVRRALAELAKSKHIRYEPPFRGRGIEKCVQPPPPFAKVPIDWKRQEFLRKLEEEKLAAMEAYIHTAKCRRAYVLDYFGQENDLKCGTCDRCDSSARKKNPDGDVLDTHRQIALSVLRCILHLRFPLGLNRVAQVVTGSRQKDLLKWRLDENPAYDSVAEQQPVVKRIIDRLIEDEYLARTGELTRPVLALTALGESIINANPSEPPSEEPPSEPPEEEPRPFDPVIHSILTAERAEAQKKADDIRRFHPRHIAAQLAEAFENASSAREKARAAWAAGELGEHYAINFLTDAAQSDDANIRRLSASALGKIIKHGNDNPPPNLTELRKTILQLTHDPAPQVRKYATKALDVLD